MTTDKAQEHVLITGASGVVGRAAVEHFAKAGYRVTIDSRSVFPRIDDPHISAVLFRAQEISRYVVD